jgi:hypothetical protein
VNGSHKATFHFLSATLLLICALDAAGQDKRKVTPVGFPRSVAEQRNVELLAAQTESTERAKLEVICERVGANLLLDRVTATAEPAGDRVFRHSGWSLDEIKLSDRDLLALLEVETKELQTAGLTKDAERNKKTVREIKTRIERRTLRSDEANQTDSDKRNTDAATPPSPEVAPRPVVIETPNGRLSAGSLHIVADEVRFTKRVTKEHADKKAQKQQVKLNCCVLELNRTQLERFGVTMPMLFWDSDHAAKLSTTDAPTTSAHILEPIAGQTLIKWLEANSVVNVLARPTIVTFNGREARLQIANEVPILNLIEKNGKKLAEIEYRQIGTQMGVTPECFGEDKIRLAIDFEHSRLVEEEKEEHRQQGVTTRKVNVAVEAKIGQTIVLTGCARTDSQNGDGEATELLIALTPERFEEAGEASLQLTAPAILPAPPVALTASRRQPSVAQTSTLPQPRSPQAAQLDDLQRAALALKEAGHADLAQAVLERAQAVQKGSATKDAQRSKDSSEPAVLREILQETRQLRKDVGQLRRDVRDLQKAMDGQNPAARETTKDHTAQSLETRVSVAFDFVRLEKVLQNIATAAGVNIVADKRGMEEEGVAPHTPVSITAHNIPAAACLKTILEPLNLVHVVEGEVVKVTSERRAQGRLITKCYSVSDLVTHNSPPVKDPMSLNSLSTLISDTVQADSWNQVGGSGVVQPHRTTNSLIVLQTEPVHQDIVVFLERLRQLRDDDEADSIE